MGSGGARPGAGRKRTTGERRQRYDLADLERIMDRARAYGGRQRTPENSPFRLPAFPPAAVPKGGGMAQDNALCSTLGFNNTAWLGGGGNFFAEGLVFPGYTFLSELAQRPEYRLMSEIIATEATRKWIRFKSTGEDDDEGDDPDKDDGEEEADDLAGDRDLSDEAIEGAVKKIMGTAGPEPEPAAGDKPGKPKGDKVENEKQQRIAELVDFLDNEIKIRKHFMEVCLHDGFFGRAHLHLDAGDTTDSELRTPIGNGRDEVSRGKIKQGFLKSIRTIEPVWCYPQGYNAQNPLQRDWYNPQQWYVMGQEINCTRLLRFVAREVPDILKPAYAFGGLSMSQMAQPYIDMWLTTSRSVNDLIHAFSVMVFQTDLAGQLEPGATGDMMARVAMFNQFRDNMGIFVTNKESEDLKNISAPLGGLHELQAQAQEHMAFVGRYPLLKFTGIQPSGLNASSEGELRTFYDNVHAYQEWFVRPGLQTVVDIAMLTLWGEVDEDIVFEFVPLWGMSEKEEGEVRKADAETDQIRIDSGVVSPEEVRKKVVADPASPYQGLDPEDVPDLAAEEMAGLVPGKGGGEVTKELVGSGAGPGGPGKPGGGPAPAPKGKEPGGADAAVLPFAQDVLDADIEEEDGEWVVYLRGRRFEGFPNHASAESWLDHFAHFGMDAEWEESKHPREDDGKFGSGGGGSTGGATKAEGGGKTSTGSSETSEAEQPIFKTKKDHAAHLLEQGTTAAELMKTLDWPSISVPAMAKSIGMKLEKIKKGKITTYTGFPMTAAERAAANLPPEGTKRSGGPASRDPSTFSLLEFIASKGGIDPKDALIGDVRSMIGSKNKFIPGFGSLIRPGGIRLDKLREAAVESNYLQDAGFRGSGQQTSTIETLFAAVDDELRGKRVYQLGQDPEHVATEKEQAAREDSRRYIENEIDAALKDADMDPASLSDKQRNRVIEIMEREGISDPLEAIEREAMEWVTNASEEGKAERILDDIEGWDVPADAGTASKPGGTAAPF